MTAETQINDAIREAFDSATESYLAENKHKAIGRISGSGKFMDGIVASVIMGAFQEGYVRGYCNAVDHLKTVTGENDKRDTDDDKETIYGTESEETGTDT